MSLDMTLSARYHSILAMIEQEAQTQRLLHPDRELKNPKLCIVSKHRPSASIRTLYEAGHRDFAENRWDSLASRWKELPDIAPHIRWHFIGHLQSRTIRCLAAAHVDLPVYCVHSVADRATLEKLERACSAKGASQSILLQVNVTGEISKQGLSPLEWEAELQARALSQISGSASSPVSIDGLMTMAPLEATKEELFAAFEELAKTRTRLLPLLPSCQQLSMGMTEDWKEALASGSDWIRIGRAIFDETVVF